MLASIPWRVIIWALAGLVALFFLGWEIFGPPRKARLLLINAIGGLAAVWGINLVGGLFDVGMRLNAAVIGASFALGAPGAALIGVLQWVLR